MTRASKGCLVRRYGVTGVTAPVTVTATLYDLADRLRRLAPSSRYPDRFHEEKSEIAHALDELAREVRHG